MRVQISACFSSVQCSLAMMIKPTVVFIYKVMLVHIYTRMFAFNVFFFYISPNTITVLA